MPTWPQAREAPLDSPASVNALDAAELVERNSG